MFVPIADVVEDVMQQSLPGFIDAVRISDIGQGTNPFRIIRFASSLLVRVRRLRCI